MTTAMKMMMVMMVTLVCLPELNTVRQKNVVLERDFIKAQKVSDSFLDLLQHDNNLRKSV